MKTCVYCKVSLLKTDFHKNIRSKDGLHSYCKSCNKKKAAKHLKTEKGKAALKRAVSKASDKGYYRFGRGAIPILKQGARKRGIEFQLTAESLEKWWKETPDICFYCRISIDEYIEIRDSVLNYTGSNFEINKFKRFFRSPKHRSIKWLTIDRVLNESGYELTNIVKCCWICNSLKNDFFDGEQMKLMSPNIIAKLISNIKKEGV